MSVCVIIATAVVLALGFHGKEVELGGGAKITNTNIEGGGVVGYGYTYNGYVIVQINEDGIYSFSAADSSGHESVFLSLKKGNVRVLLKSDGTFFGDSDSLFIHRLDKPTRETTK